MGGSAKKIPEDKIGHRLPREMQIVQLDTQVREIQTFSEGANANKVLQRMATTTTREGAENKKKETRYAIWSADELLL